MAKKFSAALAGLTLAAAMTAPIQAQARDYISIVGSSTVYPFATTVAERFGRSTKYSTPKIESTGSGGGLKLFCEGVGTSNPDITNASRRIKKSEFDRCQANGVKDIVEAKVGNDGIVLAAAKSSPDFDLSREEIFLALAAEVPNPKNPSEIIDNPYQKWSDINSELPDVKIRVLGPPPTSGTRDAFVELAMEAGCEHFDAISKLEDSNEKRFDEVCKSMREDGAFVEAGENDNLIVQKLEADPGSVGIFGFSYLDQNRGMIKGAKVNGSEPTFDSIASGDYPLSRSLYFYIKKAHVGVVPGIPEYLKEWTSEKAWGPGGYLAEKGMIPLADDLRAKMKKQILGLKPMTGDEI
ncbi:substrate-binding domain-containing protein [Marinobacteraceae bacterium S3BR75-40.1]